MTKKIVAVSGAAGRPAPPRRGGAGGLVATIVAWVLALGAGAGLFVVMQQTNARVALAKSAQQGDLDRTTSQIAEQVKALDARMEAARVAIKAQEDEQKKISATLKTLDADKHTLESDLRKKELQQSKVADQLQDTSDAVRTALAGVGNVGSVGDSEDEKLASLTKVRDSLKKQVDVAQAAKAEQDRQEAERARLAAEAEARRKGPGAKPDEGGFDYKRNFKLDVSPTVTKGTWHYNIHMQNQNMKQDLQGMHIIMLAFAESGGTYSVFLRDESDFDLKRAASYDYRTLDGTSSSRQPGWMLFITDKDNKLQTVRTNTEALEPYAAKIMDTKQYDMFNRHGGKVTPPPAAPIVIGPDGKVIQGGTTAGGVGVAH